MMAPVPLNPRKPWWAMDAVDPGAFGMLRVDDAVNVLWNLCCAHGQVGDIIQALEARRQAEVVKTVDGMLTDLEAMSTA